MTSKFILTFLCALVFSTRVLSSDEAETGITEGEDIVIKHRGIQTARNKGGVGFRLDVIDYEFIRRLEAANEVLLCVTEGGHNIVWKGTCSAQGITIKDAVVLAVESAGLKHHAIEYGFTKIDGWPVAGFIVFKENALIIDRMRGTPDRAVEFSQVGDLILMPGDVVCVVLMM